MKTRAWIRLKLINILFSMFVLFSVEGFTQNPNREFIEYSREGNNVSITTGDGQYQFKYYSTQIVGTSFLPGSETGEEQSHAVILSPEWVDINVTDETDLLKITSAGIDIHIAKNPFKVTYFYNGEEVISEKTGYHRDEEHEKIDFNIKESELLFGGGARALGMNRRGNRLQLYNRAHYGYETTSELLNYTLPVVFSSAKYLLHFDNAPIGYLDLDSGENNTLTYETISGRKTYQLVVGDSWKEIVQNYTLLTGRQPMPPRWALGNFSSRFGYRSQQEVLETIQKFKEDEIPVDAVIIDLYWFGPEIKGSMGNLEFVRDSFPNPRQMISSLEDQGVKTILVTEPFILTTSSKWEEAVEEEVLATDGAGKPFTFDFYFGNSGLIDIFKPEARDWFWNIYKDLIAMGIGGWWGDLGEPEVHPSKLRHVSGTANEMHNVYGHSWAKLVYEGYQQDFPDQRPFILMRAGAAGSQRYGLIPWSGDVNRTWGGLQSQPEIALQMGVQGLGYMHSDLGGFAGDNMDNELYVRWLQYGVFQPIYRPHGQEEVASEPVFREPQTKALAKQAIELRYRLLPYNYTLAFENNREGTPLMRPLFFEEPDSTKLYNVADTYLWGNEFLISPVLDSAQVEKSVYFPSTSNWFDFYSGKRYKGGTAQNIAVKEAYIPTFVRGGAFIPMAKPMQTTANYNAGGLEVHYYFDNDVKKSSGYVYHDNGHTPDAFKNGSYEILHLTSEVEPNALNLRIEKEQGENATPSIKLVEIIIENLDKTVELVWVNTLKFTRSNFMHEGKLVIPVWFDREVTTIKVKFK